MGIWTTIARKALNKAVEGQGREVERKNKAHDRALDAANLAHETAREVGKQSDDAAEELAVLQAAAAHLPEEA